MSSIIVFGIRLESTNLHVLSNYFFIETGHYCFLINEKTKKDFYSLYAHILGPLISDNVYKFLLYGSFVKQLFTKF